jgi:hypothetical protein
VFDSLRISKQRITVAQPPPPYAGKGAVAVAATGDDRDGAQTRADKRFFDGGAAV